MHLAPIWYPCTQVEALQHELRVFRLTVTKYLDRLTAEGFVEKHKIGSYNFYIDHRPGRVAGIGDQVQLEGAGLRVLDKDHRITRVLFEFQVAECPEKTDSEIDREEASRSVVKWSTEKILKDKMDKQEEQAAEGAAETEARSETTEEPEQLETKTAP